MSDDQTEIIQPIAQYGVVELDLAAKRPWEDRWFIFALRLALLLGLIGIEIIIILAVARLLIR